MKFLLSLAVLSFLLRLPALADSTPGPLQVNPPDGWNVKFPADNGAPVYALTKAPGDNVLLVFSKWTAPGTKEEIPNFLDSMARKFAAGARSNSRIKLASDDYTKGDFIGDPFTGKFVLFTLDGGLVQTLFMFTDGDTLWQGRYSGTSQSWLDSVEILKALRKSHSPQ